MDWYLLVELLRRQILMLLLLLAGLVVLSTFAQRLDMHPCLCHISDISCAPVHCDTVQLQGSRRRAHKKSYP